MKNKGWSFCPTIVKMINHWPTFVRYWPFWPTYLGDEPFDILMLDDKYWYAFYCEFLKNSIDF